MTEYCDRIYCAMTPEQLGDILTEAAEDNRISVKDYAELCNLCSARYEEL